MATQPPMSDGERQAARIRHGFTRSAEEAASADPGPAIAAMRDRGELDTLAVGEVRDAAWRVVIDALDYVLESQNGSGARGLEAAVRAWHTLNTVDGQVAGVNGELAEELTRCTADLAVVRRHDAELAAVARRALQQAERLGADALEGRYADLAQAVADLEPLVTMEPRA